MTVRTDAQRMLLLALLAALVVLVLFAARGWLADRAEGAPPPQPGGTAAGAPK